MPTVLALMAMQSRRESQDRLWKRIQTRFWGIFVVIYGIVLAYAGYVVRQPVGSLTYAQHAVRVLPVFVLPVVGYLVFQCMALGARIMTSYTDRQILKKKKQQGKILDGLKDAMRFEKTHEILVKYDAEYRGKMTRQGPMTTEKKSKSIAVGSTALATVGEAGIRLSSALGQLWGKAADTLISDDPALINLLRTAQSQAQILEAENMQLKADNSELRRVLAELQGHENGEAGTEEAGEQEQEVAGTTEEEPGEEEQQKEEQTALPVVNDR